MQGSFEKRVQEKLDELKLTPSEPVWKNIEKELKPKNRRRFPLWIPFIIVMLGGATWWLLESKEKESANTTTALTASPTERKGPEKKANALPGSIAESKPGEINAIPSLSDKNTTTTNRQSGNKIAVFGQPLALQTGKSGQTTNQHSTPVNKSNNPVSSWDESENKTQNKSINQTFVRNETIPENVPTQVETNSQPLGLNIIDSMQRQPADKPAHKAAVLVDSVVEKILNKEVLPLEKTDTGAIKTKVAVAKKGWKKTVTVNGGWSQFSNSVLGNSQRLADLSSSPVPGYSNSTVGNSNPVRRGAAFQVGAGVSKAIHPRLNLSIGVQYAHYSTHTKVGDYKAIDTAVLASTGNVSLAGYYNNTNLRDYTIRYGILELPVSIAFNPLVQLPLTISLGASYGRLLQANALQFDQRANIYYADKDAINKNLFAGFTSLQYILINKGAWRLGAGPMAQYHFTGLQKNSTNQKLFFAGLQSTISF